MTDKKIQQEIAYERSCLVALGLTLTESSTLAAAQAEYERLASGEGGHVAANLPISSVWHRAVKSRLANWAEWARELLPKAPANDHYSNCESCRAQGLAANTPPQVHIYGQHGNHDEAYVVGDRKGLAQLAEAIQKALDGLHGQTWAQGVAGATARDGEGYAIYVVALSEERFAGTQLPYARAAKDTPPPGRPPWSLVAHAPDEVVLEDKEWFQHPAVDDHRPVTPKGDT